MRSTLLLLTLGVLLAGCSGSTSPRPPFEGHWRKYEDENGGFVEFQNGRIRLGDNAGSREGPYTLEAASRDEPLYRVHANLSSGSEDFQLYYDRDTITLICDDDKVKGMYEIIVELVPIKR